MWDISVDKPTYEVYKGKQHRERDGLDEADAYQDKELGIGQGSPVGVGREHHCAGLGGVVCSIYSGIPKIKREVLGEIRLLTPSSLVKWAGEGVESSTGQGRSADGAGLWSGYGSVAKMSLPGRFGCSAGPASPCP